MEKDRIEALRMELLAEIDALKKSVTEKSIKKQFKCYPGANEIVIGAALLSGLFSVESFIINVNEPMEVVLIENVKDGEQKERIIEPI